MEYDEFLYWDENETMKDGGMKRTGFNLCKLLILLQTLEQFQSDLYVRLFEIDFKHSFYNLYI